MGVIKRDVLCIHPPYTAYKFKKYYYNRRHSNLCNGFCTTSKIEIEDITFVLGFKNLKAFEINLLKSNMVLVS